MHERSSMILFGYKSSGKTYFGKLISQELGTMFIDTDLWVEELYEKEFGEEIDCRRIFITIGEERFRELESRVVDSLVEVSHAMISVGGGTLLHSENCVKLQKNHKLVYLDADKEVIKQRILKGELPSFLDPQDPKRSFEQMYQERQPIYAKIQAFKVRLQGKTDRQVLDELIAIFRT